MSVSIGIVGLPNVGKSTLFNALTKQSVPAENYPFCTIDPSVGLVPVPDDRLTQLAKLSQSEEVIPAVCEFVDIAGLVRGASRGEGLGNQFLAEIREVDAIAHVVRLFDDTDVVHVDGTINPVRDIEVINTELVMADFESVSKRRKKISREVKAQDKDALQEDALLVRLEEGLNEGKSARDIITNEKEQALLSSVHLLSMKEILFVLNTSLDAGAVEDDSRFKELFAYLKDISAQWVVVDASVEYELKDEVEEEKQAFFSDIVGFEDNDSGLKRLINTSYELLGLITFFTTGEKETRGWTTPIGSTAPQAAGVIHTDFKRKFIRAEVIAWEKLVEAGSRAKARERGLIRIEGKEYVVQDGDVVEFKI